MANKKKSAPRGMVIDGVAASEAIDSSGEILRIKGVDISELEEGRGVLNFEHKGDQDAGSSFNDIIGRVIFAKKIFKEADCSNDRERMYWKKVRLPLIYIQCELFDQEDHPGAKAASSMIRHYHLRDLPILVRYSIEGTTIEKDGNNLKTSIARRIAATIKPCNRSCHSGVLEDPVVDLKIDPDKEEDPDPLKELLARKYENPMYEKIGGEIEVECNPMLDKKGDLAKALTHLKAIRKTLTAGSYNAAPGALTGGAALQVEDPYLKLWRMKNQAKAALRDWDRVSDFRKFMKHRLPEADDSFIDLFTNLVDDYEMKKARHDALRKSGEVIQTLFKALDEKAFSDVSKEAFKSDHDVFEESGRAFKPGKLKGLASHIKGMQYNIVDHTPEHYAVVPEAMGRQYKERDVKLFRKDQEGSHYMVTQPYQSVQVGLLDAVENGDVTLNRSPEQHRLIHRANLLSDATAPDNFVPHAGIRSRDSQWKVMGGGKLAFVKAGNREPFNDARREAVFYNMARNVFGMGKYVPVTAIFKHPVTGVDHAVSEAVHDGEHIFGTNDDAEDMKGSHKQAILKLSENGELQKMALMDSIMGNADRQPMNYLLTPGQDPELRLIDHGRIFKLGEGYLSHWPHYFAHALPKALGKRRGQHAKAGELPVHPSTLQWLMDLKPEAVKAELEKQKVPEPYVRETLRRLLAHQKVVQNNPQLSIGELIDAPWALSTEKEQ
jgi:hypothetical protein